jgi:hypothetical protein
MKKTILVLFISFLLFSVNAQIFQEIRKQGFYVSLLASSIVDPLIRENVYGFPGDEISCPGSYYTWNARVGWEYLKEKWGVGIGLSDWGKVKPYSPILDNPKYTNYFIDFTFNYIPITIKSVSIGLKSSGALGSRKTSYQQNNGNVLRTSDFMYSLDLGLRTYINSRYSILLEYRWIPGDRVQTTVDGVTSDPGIENYTKILSLGLIYNMGDFGLFEKIRNK